jgi:hypothetical protein
MACLHVVLAFVLLAVSTQDIVAQGTRGTAPAHVGVVLDGPSEYSRAVQAEFQSAMTAFFGTVWGAPSPQGSRVRALWNSRTRRTASPSNFPIG